MEATEAVTDGDKVGAPGQSGKQTGADGTTFSISRSESTFLLALFEWLFEPCVCYVRRVLHEMAPTSDSQLLASHLNVMEAMLDDCIGGQDPEVAAEDPKEAKKRKQHLECCFMFGLIWSVGCTTDGEQQAMFSEVSYT